MTDASRNNATWTKPLTSIPLPPWEQVIYCYSNQNITPVEDKIRILLKEISLPLFILHVSFFRQLAGTPTARVDL